jgi:hypothetical protein
VNRPAGVQRFLRENKTRIKIRSLRAPFGPVRFRTVNIATASWSRDLFGDACHLGQLLEQKSRIARVIQRQRPAHPRLAPSPQISRNRSLAESQPFRDRPHRQPVLMGQAQDRSKSLSRSSVSFASVLALPLQNHLKGDTAERRSRNPSRTPVRDLAKSLSRT